ncbi:thioredoxin reductase [Bacillus subtilis]|nr:thioredoxin reductase [Bacillus subtilis]
MAENQEVYDVTIIGGGPIGLFTCFLLRDAGAENKGNRIFAEARREGVFILS